MIRVLFVFRTQVQFLRTQGIRVAADIKEVAFADEAGHKSVFWMMVDAVGVPVLLDDAVVHDDDAVAHGEGFFLVMGYKDEGETKASL